MDSIEVCLSYQDENPDIPGILIAELDEIGFDSYWEEAGCLYAYIESTRFDPDALHKVYTIKNKTFGDIRVEYSQLKEKNWNEYWEKNFQPVVVNDNLIIKAPFHNISDTYKHEIILEPKMSFGTGHHATTWLMLATMGNMEFKNKKVLDIGCGTGVLAIYAAMLGAYKVTAIDNNQWAYENAVENAMLNRVEVEVVLGDINSLDHTGGYDSVLANINRNVILDEAQYYVGQLSKGGIILFSGILSESFIEINQKALGLGLGLEYRAEKDNWLVLRYKHTGH